MILTREEVFNRIQAMVASLAEKDITDKEVIACTSAIVNLCYDNFEEGIDTAFASTIKHFGLDRPINEPPR